MLAAAHAGYFSPPSVLAVVFLPSLVLCFGLVSGACFALFFVFSLFGFSGIGRGFRFDLPLKIDGGR